MRFGPAAILSIAVAATGAAANDGYKCTPKQAVQLLTDGSLASTSATEALLSSNQNREFVVDGKTGRIIGGGAILNWNDATGTPKVIDKGSDVQAFKVLTIHKPPFVSVDYLQINEFDKGHIKPFIFLRHGTAVAGTCQRY